MGYSTEFSGRFDLNKPLDSNHYVYLMKFNDVRHMKRDPAKIKLPDPIREAVGLPVGRDGEFFVGATDFKGQGQTSDIIDYNAPPPEVPGLWCGWTPSQDGCSIQWDGGEKFYGYIDWIKYLINHFLKPWGYILNGEVTWQGEDSSDIGKIVIKDNVVSTKHAKLVWEE